MDTAFEPTIGTLTRAETLAAWIEAGTWDVMRVVEIPARLTGGSEDGRAIFAAHGCTAVILRPDLSGASFEMAHFVRFETAEDAANRTNDAADSLSRTLSLMVLAHDLRGDAGPDDVDPACVDWPFSAV